MQSSAQPANNAERSTVCSHFPGEESEGKGGSGHGRVSDPAPLSDSPQLPVRHVGIVWDRDEVWVPVCLEKMLLPNYPHGAAHGP